MITRSDADHPFITDVKGRLDCENRERDYRTDDTWSVIIRGLLGETRS